MPLSLAGESDFFIRIQFHMNREILAIKVKVMSNEYLTRRK